MAIYLLRMLNGEELMASMNTPPEKGETSLELENVVRIVVMPNKMDPSAPSIGFAPYSQFTKDVKITIDKQHVVAIMNPITQFVTQYKQLYSTVLTPENKGLILPK